VVHLFYYTHLAFLRIINERLGVGGGVGGFRRRSTGAGEVRGRAFLQTVRACSPAHLETRGKNRGGIRIRRDWMERLMIIGNAGKDNREARRYCCVPTVDTHCSLILWLNQNIEPNS
jgi:hypothetical protein